MTTSSDNKLRGSKSTIHFEIKPMPFKISHQKEVSVKFCLLALTLILCT